MTEYDYIAIGMPIPVTVFATLGDLISKAWPGAVIITDPEAAQVPADVRRYVGYSRDVSLLRIPKRAPKRVSKKAAEEIADANAREADGEPVDFMGFHSEENSTWVRMAPPEELGAFLSDVGIRLLDSVEGAINYVEWECVDRETHARTVLSVARSKGQTPGALRKRAEARVEDLERALHVALAHARGEVECADDVRAQELEGARMVLDGETSGRS